MTQNDLKGLADKVESVAQEIYMHGNYSEQLNEVVAELRRLQPEGQLPAAIGPHVFFSRGVAHSSSAGSSGPLCKVCGEDKDYSAHSELTAGILGFHHFEPQAGCLHKPQPSPSSSSPGQTPPAPICSTCGKTRGAGEHSDDYLKMHTFRPVAGQTNVPQMGQPRDYGD